MPIVVIKFAIKFERNLKRKKTFPLFLGNFSSFLEKIHTKLIQPTITKLLNHFMIQCIGIRHLGLVPTTTIYLLQTQSHDCT